MIGLYIIENTTDTKAARLFSSNFLAFTYLNLAAKAGFCHDYCRFITRNQSDMRHPTLWFDIIYRHAAYFYEFRRDRHTITLTGIPYS